MSEQLYQECKHSVMEMICANEGSVFHYCPQCGTLRKSGNFTGLVTTRTPTELAALRAELVAVREERKQFVSDLCDNEVLIRNVCRPHIPPIDVDGDSHGVPSIVDVVEVCVSWIAAERDAAVAVLSHCDVVMDTAAQHGLPQQLPEAYRDSWARVHIEVRAALTSKGGAR